MMSFKSRDLMSDVLPAEGFYACGDITKAQAPCADPSRVPEPPPEPPPEITEVSLALLRNQLREALSMEQAARG
jgi:hypothetical protein